MKLWPFLPQVKMGEFCVWSVKKGFSQKTVQQHIWLSFQRLLQLIEIIELHITLKTRLDKKNQHLALRLLFHVHMFVCNQLIVHIHPHYHLMQLHFSK